MAQEKVVTVSDSDLAGRECEFCRHPLAAGEQAVVCPRCRAVHHVDCWRQKGGCARHGCRQVAIAILPPKPAASPPPAPAPSYWQRLRLWQKTAIIGILALLVGAVIAAVGYHATRPGAPETRLVLVVPADLWEGERYSRIAARFEADHPGVKVQVINTPYAGYEQKLAIMFAARDQLDVFALAPSRVPLYASNGALLALDSRVEELKAAGRADLAALAYRFGDSVYGMRRGPEWPALFVVSRHTRHPDLSWRLLVTILSETVKDPPPPPGYSLEPRIIPDLSIP
ncbi:MAG: extracellular solute-binding protein [Limnochordales bacterium]|nr:extracellular solute-binding protein [Limnochordales bacterium]